VDGRSGSVSPPDPDAPDRRHQRIRYPHWGDGVVQRVAGESIVALFESVGYQTTRPPAVPNTRAMTSVSWDVPVTKGG
jgi:hypothetical protein